MRMQKANHLLVPAWLMCFSDTHFQSSWCLLLHVLYMISYRTFQRISGRVVKLNTREKGRSFSFAKFWCEAFSNKLQFEVTCNQNTQLMRDGRCKSMDLVKRVRGNLWNYRLRLFEQIANRWFAG